MSKKYQVSIIVPCYNEEENIAECITRISKTDKTYEIVVVDDGSKDKTTATAKFLKKHHSQLKVISYSSNRGKGNAVRTGLTAAKGEILAILDADMTVRPEDLPKILEPILKGRAEFVNVTRFQYEMENNAMKGLNNLANRFMAFLFSIILMQKVTDTLCGTKVFFKKHFLQVGIHPEDPWGDFSELFWIKMLKLKMVEVPVKYYARVAGTSKMKFFQHGYKMLRIFTKLYRANL